ncbi:MAG: exodeoxyribonuclease VII small subunit [Planctomycetota bacterium]
MPAERKRSSEPEPGFDARLMRLEAIVAELENEKIPLETAIERYQEGVQHLRSCRAILDGYQKRVEQLTADAEGGTTPYAGDPDADAKSLP